RCGSRARPDGARRQAAPAALRPGWPAHELQVPPPPPGRAAARRPEPRGAGGAGRRRAAHPARDHGRLMDILELSEGRYHRQTLIEWWDQARVAAAKVLVVGAGALGGEILKLLALVGVGRTLLWDFDRVETSNLSRGVLF